MKGPFAADRVSLDVSQSSQPLHSSFVSACVRASSAAVLGLVGALFVRRGLREWRKGAATGRCRHAFIPASLSVSLSVHTASVFVARGLSGRMAPEDGVLVLKRRRRRMTGKKGSAIHVRIGSKQGGGRLNMRVSQGAREPRPEAPPARRRDRSPGDHASPRRAARRPTANNSLGRWHCIACYDTIVFPSACVTTKQCGL